MYRAPVLQEGSVYLGYLYYRKVVYRAPVLQEGSV